MNGCCSRLYSNDGRLKCTPVGGFQASHCVTGGRGPAPTPSPPPTPNPALVHKVRVQLDGRNYLHCREVKVFDTSGVNHALNKLATQSSTYWDPASKAANGYHNDWSHTNNDAGMYHELTDSNLIVYTIMSF